MALATAVPAGTWTADKIHSTIGFEVEHMVSTFRGRFEDYDARLVDGKLIGTVALEGDLTIKGITKPVTARGRYVHVEADMGGGERIGLGLDTTLDRREFGLEWNAPLPKGGLVLGNDVTLTVALELVRAES